MDWLGGTVLASGNISEPDPGLVTVTDDVEEAVGNRHEPRRAGHFSPIGRGPDGQKERPASPEPRDRVAGTVGRGGRSLRLLASRATA